MGLIITGYLIGVAAVAMLLINRERKEENAILTYELLEANRRAVAAEKRLDAAGARHLLPAPQDVDPYRGALYAAHARIIELERREREQDSKASPTIYIIPDGAKLSIGEGRLRVDPPALPAPFPQPPPEELP